MNDRTVMSVAIAMSIIFSAVIFSCGILFIAVLGNPVYVVYLFSKGFLVACY